MKIRGQSTKIRVASWTESPLIRWRHPIRRAASLLALAIEILVLPALAGMDMFALDVGEGQSVFLEQNGHGMLVDTDP